MNRKLLVFNYIILLHICTFYSSKCQTFIIFKDDTLKMAKLIDGMSERNARDQSLISFKDSLPDGKYILYDLNMEDSLIPNRDQFILMSGEYKDSTKCGVFINYCFRNNKKSTIDKPCIIYNYKNGLLNGYYSSSLSNGVKKDEGYYDRGLKNGFFIEYDFDGNIRTIELWEKDTLKNWSKYNKKCIYESGFGEPNKSKGYFRLYDGECNLIVYYEFDEMKTIYIEEYYKNGNIRLLAKGSILDYVYSFNDEIVSQYKLVNGFVNIYDKQGHLIKK